VAILFRFCKPSTSISVILLSLANKISKPTILYTHCGMLVNLLVLNTNSLKLINALKQSGKLLSKLLPTSKYFNLEHSDINSGISVSEFIDKFSSVKFSAISFSPPGTEGNLFLHKSTIVTSAVLASSNTSSGTVVSCFIVKFSARECFMVYLKHELVITYSVCLSIPVRKCLRLVRNVTRRFWNILIFFTIQFLLQMLQDSNCTPFDYISSYFFQLVSFHLKVLQVGQQTERMWETTKTNLTLIKRLKPLLLSEIIICQIETNQVLQHGYFIRYRFDFVVS
jgi:hypothetical protein